MQTRATSMRTSDAERQRVAEFLRDACGDGRLSPEELEQRLDQLFTGSTVADITVLVRDLPGGSAVIPRLGRSGPPRRVAVTAVPVRRRPHSPAVPFGFALLVGGLVWLGGGGGGPGGAGGARGAGPRPSRAAARGGCGRAGGRGPAA